MSKDMAPIDINQTATSTDRLSPGGRDHTEGVPSPIIQLTNVSKCFVATWALDRVSLSILPGRIIGLLGGNGAGKSSLLRVMVGLYVPTEGQCLTLGKEARKLGAPEMARIGYVHQNGDLFNWMTVEQHIRYVSVYYKTWNEDLEKRFVEQFELPLHTRVKDLSPGVKQRLAILLAMGHEPELLILDEPAAALDPIARMQFLDLLMETIQKEGRTVIISSHILSDVEKIVDHAIIMDRGRILRDVSFDSLQDEFMRVRIVASNKSLPEAWPFKEVIECKRSEDEAVLLLHNTTEADLAQEEDTLSCRIQRLPLSLDEIFKLVVTRKPGEGKMR